MTHNKRRKKRPIQSPSLFSLFLKYMGKLLLSLVGISLLALTATAYVALGFWSPVDPSWSYASDNFVQNPMGYYGAVFADLVMQFLGLAGVAFLFPFLFWAVALILQKRTVPFLRCALFALLAVAQFSFSFAFLNVEAQKALPNGLGGILGKKLLDVFYSYVSLPQDFWSHFGCATFAFFLSSVSLLLACRTKRLVEKKLKEEQEENFEEDFYREPGFLKIWIGRFIHLFLLGRAFLLKPFKKKERKLPVKAEFSSYSYDRREEDDDTFAYRQGVASLQKKAYGKSSKMRMGREGEKNQFSLPTVEFLRIPKQKDPKQEIPIEQLQKNARRLEKVLEDFGVKGRVLLYRQGPIVTLYEFEPAPGIKSSRIISLSDDVARLMSAHSARICVLPGRNALGIELPNEVRETVYLRELLESSAFQDSPARLGIALGKSISGENIIADLSKMPHLLVAGTTGSGKSVAINTMILSLIYRLTPDQCRFIMVDPKMLELSVYNDIPHLLTPVVTDPKKAVVALKWAVREMEDRYRKMSKVGVRNIEGFNEKIIEANARGEDLSRMLQTDFEPETGALIYETEVIEKQPLPYIVVVIDEMADLMLVAGKEIEGAVQRLAQMARAAGIHLLMATQRPSVDVITGTIKANFPTRISFSLTSKIDSRTILGEAGAEQLLGQGDMLFMMGGGRMQRVHGPFVSDEEVEIIVQHLKAQGQPTYLENILQEVEDGNVDKVQNLQQSEDPYDQAVAIVLRDQKVSTSYIQRRLSIGYNRAASIIERMEEEGLISPANHVGKREILVKQSQEPYLDEEL